MKILYFCIGMMMSIGGRADMAALGQNADLTALLGQIQMLAQQQDLKHTEAMRAEEKSYKALQEKAEKESAELSGSIANLQKELARKNTSKEQLIASVKKVHEQYQASVATKDALVKEKRASQAKAMAAYKSELVALKDAIKALSAMMIK